MSFTTLITKNLPLGMKIYKKCQTSPILLIMNVTKLNLKQNIYFFKLISTLKPSIGKYEFGDLDHFTSKPFKLFRAYPYVKPHILFYSNSLAICHGFPGIGLL